MTVGGLYGDELIRIVGSGLIGASIGLALRGHGMRVALTDTSPTALALARDLGAGDVEIPAGMVPSLVVVAVPPDVAAPVVAEELRRWPQATVTDVASVKSVILRELQQCGLSEEQLSRYVGSHPMAGRERSGAIAAKADLCDGRPWVIAPHPLSSVGAVESVERLANEVGALVTLMDADEHDAAVAAVSHVPQLAASLIAGRLLDLPTRSVGLAGAGLRDMTRIAGSDPALWTSILAGNATAIGEVLAEVAQDLGAVAEALNRLSRDADTAVGARAVLARVIADGNSGHARIPGKHGAPAANYATVTAMVGDRPGELGRLLVEVGEEGVNLEDLHLEHNLGQLTGAAEISVIPAAAEPLRAALRRRGWTVLD